MVKRFIFVIILLCCYHLAFTLELQSINTRSIGGVTLFDIDSPFVGINNPALLAHYGWIDQINKLALDDPIPEMSDVRATDNPLPDPIEQMYDPRYLEGVYYPGRFYFLNTALGIGFSLDFLAVSTNAVNMFKGSMAGRSAFDPYPVPLLNLVQNTLLSDFIRLLSLGRVDLAPLFSGSTDSDSFFISNAALVSTHNKLGFSAEAEINWLSFYRQGFGASLYTGFDGYGGLLGKDQSFLFLIHDPVVKFTLDTGLALSFAVPDLKIPVFGRINGGLTVRPHFTVQGGADSMSNYVTLIRQLSNYMTNLNPFDTSAFGDGRVINAGYGASVDLALIKSSSDNLLFSLKLSDLIAPVYWLNSKSMGWILPDLAAGLKYTFDIPYWLRFIINKPSFYLEIKDLLYTHPVVLLNKVHFGVDTKLLFDVITIGGGINQGYPVFGASLHASFNWLKTVQGMRELAETLSPLTYANIKLYYSLYGKELGTYPGDLGFYSGHMGFELFWGFN